MIKNNYYTSKKILNSKICLGFFSRKNGFSEENYSSLNCSYSSGDKHEFVDKNIVFAKKQLNLENSFLKTLNQVHSNKVIFVDKNNINKKIKADGMITQDKKISIAILTADCCPIFLFDDQATFISCLHAGWKGCYNNIAKEALTAIKKIQPDIKKINAIIGPCINKKNFEVTEDFKFKFLRKNQNYKKFFYKNDSENKTLFDMRRLIKSQIRGSGITNIENINIDTYSNKKLFYSHRRSTHNNQLNTGRMINIIGFNNQII